MTMRRRRTLDDLDNSDFQQPRSRGRALRVVAEDDGNFEEPAAEAITGTQSLSESLVSLCGRFGLEPWAASDDGHGLRAFGSALTEWLDQPDIERPASQEFQLEAIRLLTNLLIIVGAAIQPAVQAEPSACQRSLEAVVAARRSVVSLIGPVACSPGSARAMERLVRVRGWNRLTAAQQTLAESLLDLYLETLAAMLVAASNTLTTNVLLATADAWLTTLHLQALPLGFDERVLRATSWYLESYTSSQPR